MAGTKAAGRAGNVHDPNASTPTVAQLAERWLRLYVALQRSPFNAEMAVRRVARYLVVFMGSRPVGSLGPDDFRLYRIWLDDLGLAPRTVRHLLGDARCMMNWAVEGQILASSPFPRRVMPRIPESPPDRLGDDEVARVLAVGEPYRFVCWLAVATGLRWGELCRVEREHVRAGLLMVPHTKSGRVRRVPVHPLLRVEIENRTGPLVPFGVGSAGSFNKIVARESGVARFHVHQLRHTFACRWIERGGSLAALQQILGHASVVTTQHYAKLSDEHVRREAERIAGSDEVRERAPHYR